MKSVKKPSPILDEAIKDTWNKMLISIGTALVLGVKELGGIVELERRLATLDYELIIDMGVAVFLRSIKNAKKKAALKAIALKLRDKINQAFADDPDFQNPE